jgi:putative endonuclease
LTVAPAQAGAQSPVLEVAYVYILCSRTYGTLYVGVTSDLVKRVWQLKNDLVPGFTREHGVHRLVWYETHASILEAIAREKRIKRWHRDWKVNLIQSINPEWRDLYPEIAADRN